MESQENKTQVSIIPLGMITVGGLVIVIFFTAIIGFGLEIGSQLAWFFADSLKLFFQRALG